MFKPIVFVISLLRSWWWPMIYPTLRTLMTEAGQSALAVAREFIRQAETQDGWTGAEKRAFVRREMEKANASGKWSKKLINRVLELALGDLEADEAVTAEASTVSKAGLAELDKPSGAV